MKRQRWVGAWPHAWGVRTFEKGEDDHEQGELLERYEALGEMDDFLEAKRLFEQDLGEQPDALLLRQYGYLLESHGRYSIRRAVELYERAIALHPDEDKVRWQWMNAKA